MDDLDRGGQTGCKVQAESAVKVVQLLMRYKKTPHYANVSMLGIDVGYVREPKYVLSMGDVIIEMNQRGDNRRKSVLITLQMMAFQSLRERNFG